MSRDINSILKDLYKIDPHLSSQEPLLRKMIEELLKSEPDTKFDQNFAQQLRARLMASEMQTEDVQKKFVVSPLNSIFAYIRETKWGYGLAGAFVALVIILPLTNSQVETGLTLKQIIQNKGSETFGSLNFAGDLGRGAMLEGAFSMDSGAVAKDNGSSEAQIMIAPTIASMPGNEGGGMSGRSGMVYPEMVRYIYEGEPFTLTETEGQVFMRVKGLEAGKQIALLLNKADFGLINLSSFDELETRSIELVQNKPNGYSITVNFNEGIMYIMPNWEQWNQQVMDTPVSVDESRSAFITNTNAVSVPSNETIIALANGFLNKHGIDREVYGSPVVDNHYLEMIESDPTRSSIMPIYASEQVTVIYPLTIAGKEVYDEQGTLYGLHVNVNIVENKVSGVNNLTSQLYDSSTYTLETDASKILEYVVSPVDMYYGQNVRIKNIRLGTPQKALMKFWDYNGSVSPREMYVPALKFPVVAGDNTPYAQKAILVPIVKDMLDRYKNGAPEIDSMPAPMPRPL